MYNVKYDKVNYCVVFNKTVAMLSGNWLYLYHNYIPKSYIRKQIGEEQENRIESFKTANVL